MGSRTSRGLGGGERGADVALSVNGVPIRLTAERWRHIVGTHHDPGAYYDEVLAAIESPERVLRGPGGVLMAVRGFGRRRYFVVVYRETSRRDGFVITAYFTSTVDRRASIWPSRP